MKIVFRIGMLAAAGALLLAPVHPADAAAKSDYWTPERMRSAVPVEQLLPNGKLQPQSSGKVALGKLSSIGATAAAASSPLEPGAAWTGGGKIVKTEGRVFFTYTGRRASCSGTAVTSANKSTVITAGHCVKLDGSFHKDWVFVPAYNNGKAPYGTWSARMLRTTPQWQATEDLQYDVGAAVVNRLNGRSLTDVVGGQGIAFGSLLLQQVYAFGYPAADPWDGTKLIYSSGVVLPGLLTNGNGLISTLTGGASGGGWFRSFNPSTGTGLLSSVNSYKISPAALPLNTPAIFGPVFGADAQNLYNAAQAS